jgi:hypothetical protein
MRRFRHQRKPLIKMKNGRHRVATATELALSGEATQAKLAHLTASAIANRLSSRIEAMLTEGASGALPPDLRQKAIDAIVARISDGWGEEIGKSFCKAAGRDYDRGFVLDAMVQHRRRRFELQMSPAPHVILRGYMPGFEWNFDCEVPLR